jgi:hypothetical protein
MRIEDATRRVNAGDTSQEVIARLALEIKFLRRDMGAAVKTISKLQATADHNRLRSRRQRYALRAIAEGRCPDARTAAREALGATWVPAQLAVGQDN